MIVQDLSSSMNGPPNESGPIDDAREAADASLTEMLTPFRPGDRWGLTVFAEATSAWAPMALLPDGEQQLREQIAGLCHSDTGCVDPTLPHVRSDDIGRCTNPGPALREATEQLTELPDPTATRTILLMLDGPTNCGEGLEGALHAVDDAWDAHGVHVHTVRLFGPQRGAYDPATDDSVLLTRGRGTHQAVDRSHELVDAYRAVARSLPLAPEALP
ncbi:MAG: VWA domain-containing protein [Myxococcales bacterium]|nr:VWA domain-containing protein [Myxococcales bacterium]